MSEFQADFFQTGKRPALGQQFGFERTPAGLGLRIVVEFARPAEAGHGLGLVDVGATGCTRELTAAVGVDDKLIAGWHRVRACSKAVSPNSVGICAASC